MWHFTKIPNIIGPDEEKCKYTEFKSIYMYDIQTGTGYWHLPSFRSILAN